MKVLRIPASSRFLSRPPPAPRIQRINQARCFLTAPTQTLNACRTLPYPSQDIYSIIVDVPSYSSFLPYCKQSKVTRWSNPDHDGQKWPEEAQLVVGWSGIQETFTSQVYCVPGKIVEAVAGRSRTKLKDEEIRHHTDAGKNKSSEYTASQSASSFPSTLNPFAAAPSSAPQEKGNGILTSLMTRWTVRPFQAQPPKAGDSTQAAISGSRSLEHTEVSLAIEFQFANPIYSAMSAAVTDRMAGVMIEAFEARVRQILGETSKQTRASN